MSTAGDEGMDFVWNSVAATCFRCCQGLGVLLFSGFLEGAKFLRFTIMKIRNSLKSAKLREKGCRIVRRRGRVYVINKKNPRFKARQG